MGNTDQLDAMQKSLEWELNHHRERREQVDDDDAVNKHYYDGYCDGIRAGLKEIEIARQGCRPVLRRVRSPRTKAAAREEEA